MRVIHVFALLVLFGGCLSLVEARELDSPPSSLRSPTGLVTGVADSTVAVSSVPIVPVSVRASAVQTLSGISTIEKSTQDVLQVERAQYQLIRARLQDASSAEQSSLRNSLSLQRQRVLMAILNRLSVIYQRVDLVISKMETSLLRLDILHDQRGGVSEYAVRYAALKSQFANLQDKSDQAARLLESCPSSVDLGACVRSSKEAVSVLLADLPAYYSAYRSLVSDVLSS